MTNLTKYIVTLVKDNFIKFDDQQKALQIVREALQEYQKENKRKVPMIEEYEKIYQDWIKERPQYMADTPVTRVVLEDQKALRRVMQGTFSPQQEKEER